MKNFIRRRLHENWWAQDEPQVETPLSKELEALAHTDLPYNIIEDNLKEIESKYAKEYAEYDGDSYGVIEAIKQVIPVGLKQIYDSMHPKVNYESIKEGGPSNKNLEKYISIGMKTAFDNNKEAATAHLHKILDGLKNLKDTVTLYRIVFVNDPKDIDTKNVGDHYVLKRNQLERSHNQKSHVGSGNPYMLTVKADKALIDYDSTISTNMQYPHETEITLKDNGLGAKIINVEPFQTNDEDLIGTPEDMDSPLY